MLHTLYRLFRRVPLEAYLWTAGLLVLAGTNPEAEAWIEACLSKWIWNHPCPGCGLGHAVAYLLQGEVLASFEAHPLGPAAGILLIGRVVGLVHEAFTRPLV